MTTGLNQTVEQKVKEVFIGLLESFEKKRLSGRKLVSDEEIIYNSLKNPKLGDVKVTVFPGPPIQIFINNRRDPDSPFAVMDSQQRRDFIERRAVEESKDNDIAPALYLISFNDRETLKNPNLERVEFYSVFLGLVDDQEEKRLPPGHELLDRPYESLNPSEKMILLNVLAKADPIRNRIKTELFDFSLKYARYKQSEEQRIVTIPPDQIAEHIGQLSRDMYPQNLRTILLRDFPKDHDRICNYVKDRLESLNRLITGRLDLDDGQYSYYLRQIQQSIVDQIRQIDMLASRRR
ncbi:MAG: hypothetical protein H3C43_00330 [Leptonema sp. (in: Bacteria)]|nr:hypothetical protein [Leptonema sp. (in: bacteria)]